MSPERYRLLLWSTGLLLLAASGAIVGWGLLGVIQQTPVVKSTPMPPHAKAQSSSVPPIAEFQSLWKKRLRRELQDVPPPVQAATTPARAKSAATLGIKLLGTILETGRTLAVFQAPAGSMEIRSEGEMIGEPGLGVEVLKIEPDRVEIRYQGEVLSLDLKPKAI